ncbi:hypothetical protein RFI_34581 [Reticulomyxa filosa]|uniref:Uncharacterized protein n=1 Tax=Reticulomyxa filosa TaxID=46433 RepID=X6LNW3_RETFI|nr:hypothetical protein RFI_34581 [Reticulomyxa filosa]|eukprot:ETO02832.1 hypothetical protein RFI_34581 [Reticulomyxa filosa]
MILLIWVKYDQYIQQTMQISAIWNHEIDVNLIYLLLSTVQGGIDEVNEGLYLFQVWKIEGDNEQRYKKRMKKFINRRCCNRNINLLVIFLSEKFFLKNATAIECATFYTVNNGLPFVERDKVLWIKYRKNKRIKVSYNFCFACCYFHIAIFVHQNLLVNSKIIVQKNDKYKCDKICFSVFQNIWRSTIKKNGIKDKK